MATDYTRNAYGISVVVYSAFNRNTGASSNIDDIIGAANAENVVYAGGDLKIADGTVNAGDYVGVDDGDAPVRLSAAEIAANYTAV